MQNEAPMAGFNEENARRRRMEKNADYGPFIRDVDKIMYSPYFSRYADKTQVFSLCKNDDLTRRSLHVQLVSRIARTIGRELGLNLDLIEAIALGHDIGHPAFAHTGESLIDKLYYKNTGRRFLHNIHSVRVLDKIHDYNLTLEVLDGIAAHNGELELSEYRPVPLSGFEEFDKRMESCALDMGYAMKIMPSTLEGAVVRISDIIAYLGKDRQDAVIAGAVHFEDFEGGVIGTKHSEIAGALMKNIIENSKGKPYIRMDEGHFAALKQVKKENYEKIYNRAAAHTGVGKVIEPMFTEVYAQLLDDLKRNARTSPVFTHHVQDVVAHGNAEYPKTEPNQIVVDYLASMTDDYFIELHGYLFKDSPLKPVYRGYFNEEK